MYEYISGQKYRSRRAVGIEVTTNWVGMESEEEDVEQRIRNNLQTSI